MIYRAKSIDIMTSIVSSTSCFRHNSEEKSTKFSISKIKLNKTDRSFSVEILE